MPHVISNPWDLGFELDESASVLRECAYADGVAVVYPGQVKSYCSVTGKHLERKVIFSGSDVYSLFELPGPALGGDSSVYERVCVVDPEGDLVDTFDVVYENADTKAFMDSFDKLLNSAYFLCRQVFKSDRALPPVVCWSGVFEEFFAHKDDDPAQQASIVDLAHEIPLHLDKVTSHPRRTLRRIRDQERIQRVREMDKACLIALARRPGLAIAEKAGPSQRILAVKREETANTLENRVVHHCCHLIRRSAERYISAHKDKHIDPEKSTRLKAVCAFERKAIKWSRSDALNGVAMLSSPCKSPNYVLLQNPSYLRIWQAYTTLVKNEELRANVWRWPLQLWRGIATVVFAKLFSQWIKRLGLPVKVTVAENRIVGAPRSFVQGRFLNHDSLPGPYILGRSVDDSGTLHLVDQGGLSRLYPQDPASQMNADYYMVWVTENQRRIIPVYCRAWAKDSSGHESEGHAALNRLKSFGEEFAGVILLWPGANVLRAQTITSEDENAHAWLLQLPTDPEALVKNERVANNSPLEWLVR